MFLLLIQVAKVQIEPGAGPPSPAQLKKLLLQQVISDSGARAIEELGGALQVLKELDAFINEI